MKKLTLILAIFIFLQGLFSQDTEKRGIGLKSEEKKGALTSYFFRNWALIIGIDKYRNATPLRYAVNDAKAVRDLIVNEFGFGAKNVIELYDEQATKDNILRAFDELIKNTDENDRVFIFYAGHGITMPLPEGKERGYILPVDADPSKPVLTAISTDQLNEFSEAMPAKHLYFVMDACYGGLIFTRSQPVSAEVQNFLEVISTRRTRQAITAGGRDQPVFDTGPSGHSVFTFHFINGLKTMSADLDKNGVITASEIASYILPRVTAESKGQQTPQYGILIGDRGGEFYFIPRPRVSVIDVSVFPEGADIFINDKPVGKAPAQIDIYEFGPVKVQIKKDGYLDFEQVVDVSDNYYEIKATLEKASMLVIKSNPSGAEVYVNDKPVGKTPITLPKLKKAKHTVKLALKDHQDFMQEVDLSQVDKSEIDVKLEKMKCEFNITGVIGNADVFIKGDNFAQKFDRLPLRNFKLEYGEYEIAISKVGYYDFRQRVSVKQPQLNLPVDLHKKSKSRSIIMSLFLPGTGQIYMGRQKLGYPLLGLSIIGASSSIFTFIKYNQFNNAYIDYRNKYLSATKSEDIENYYSLMMKNYNDMKNFKNYFLISAGVTAGVWIFNFIDSIIFSPEEVYSVSRIKLGTNGRGINVEFKF
jgi:hypothetical protein